MNLLQVFNCESNCGARGFQDTNSTLQKSGVSLTVTDTSSNNTTNNQSGLEADDSKSESSFIEVFYPAFWPNPDRGRVEDPTFFSTDPDPTLDQMKKKIYSYIW